MENKVAASGHVNSIKARGCAEGDMVVALHPAWRALFQFCREMGHGEIEKLTIQDGLPVIAQVTKKKVKFV